jgi:group I intron endonuclease
MIKKNIIKELISQKFYYNAGEDKLIIYTENKGKAGVYKWTNKMNNNSYVGSSKNLRRRLSDYYSFSRLKTVLKRGRSLISDAILKYDISNFSLDILEYCEPNMLTIKEQYYIDLFNPKYNLCKKANSPLGVKRNTLFSINLSKAKRGKKIYKTKINENKVIKFVNVNTKTKIFLRNIGISVKVFDPSNNLIKEFSSMSDAAKFFNVHPSTISRIYKRGKSYDGLTYEFNIKDNKVGIYDKDHKLINIMDNAKKISLFYNIPKSTLYDYIKSGKLYKNQYYLKKINK